jgi:hypothetical protein
MLRKKMIAKRRWHGPVRPITVGWSPRLAWTWMLLMSILAGGCGPANPLGRKAVSGKITLNGAPLENGNISFSPKSDKGVSSGAVIVGGAYSIETEKGLPEGEYVVRIFAATPDTRAPDPNLPPGPRTSPPGIDLIPPEYNARSDKVARVTAEGPNEFNFDIVTKKR